MKKGWTSIAIILILIGFIFYMNQAETTPREARPEVGFLAPDFTLTNESGQDVTLSQFKGKPVFINLWASWCPPCKEEMPYIQEAYTKYKDQVVFLGINETGADNKEEAIDFMKSNNYEMPILFDYDLAISNIYRANTIPTSFFIDKEGVIKVKHRGAMSYEQIESYIKTVLEER